MTATKTKRGLSMLLAFLLLAGTVSPSVLAADAEPTATPLAETTAEPTSTPEQGPEETPSAVTSDNPVEQPMETPEASAEPMDEPEASVEPSETPTPGDEAVETPEPSAEPTEIPEPSTEPTASPEPTEEPEATASPEPTEEPEATASPEPTEEPENDEAPVTDGTWDNGKKGNGAWTYDPEKNTLTISGKGEIPDYNEEDPAPWSAFREDIYKVHVKENITAIGKNAFAGCKEMAEIRLPKEIVSVGEKAFSGCDKLRTVTFAGTKAEWEQIAVAKGNDILSAPEKITVICAAEPVSEPAEDPESAREPEDDAGAAPIAEPVLSSLDLSHVRFKEEGGTTTVVGFKNNAPVSGNKYASESDTIDAPDGNSYDLLFPVTDQWMKGASIEIDAKAQSNNQDNDWQYEGEGVEGGKKSLEKNETIKLPLFGENSIFGTYSEDWITKDKKVKLYYGKDDTLTTLNCRVVPLLTVKDITVDQPGVAIKKNYLTSDSHLGNSTYLYYMSSGKVVREDDVALSVIGNESIQKEIVFTVKTPNDEKYHVSATMEGGEVTVEGLKVTAKPTWRDDDQDTERTVTITTSCEGLTTYTQNNGEFNAIAVDYKVKITRTIVKDTLTATTQLNTAYNYIDSAESFDSLTFAAYKKTGNAPNYQWYYSDTMTQADGADPTYDWQKIQDGTSGTYDFSEWANRAKAEVAGGGKEKIKATRYFKCTAISGVETLDSNVAAVTIWADPKLTGVKLELVKTQDSGMTWEPVEVPGGKITLNLKEDAKKNIYYGFRWKLTAEREDAIENIEYFSYGIRQYEGDISADERVPDKKKNNRGDDNQSMNTFNKRIFLFMDFEYDDDSSYSYFIPKFLRLVGQHTYLPYFIGGMKHKSAKEFYESVVNVKPSEGIVVTVEADEASEPDITTQPKGAFYDLGARPNELTVKASCDDGGTLSYQWQKSSDGETGWEDIPGATDSYYALTTSNEKLTVYYRCVVTNTINSKSKVITATAESNAAKIAFGAEAPWVGSGTAEDPYQLGNLADLNSLRKSVNEDGRTWADTYFKLTADINLGSKWTPIGCLEPGRDSAGAGAYIRPFSGNLDGGGKRSLTYSNGSRPLFGYLRQATISNVTIKGSTANAFVDGNGVVENYVIDYGPTGSGGGPWTAKFNNVTISKCIIKGSGFISGSASGGNKIYFTNCTVDNNVKIGCNSDGTSAGNSGVGSFAGILVGGTLTGCVSSAEVYGAGSVGGIVGSHGSSTTVLEIKNCQFHGKVIATGNGVGGIMGSGYYNATAPNAYGVTIEDCEVDGTVTGADRVGGIYGAESGIDQFWANGPEILRRNRFTGTVSGTGIVGAIIGYLRSMNRNVYIENNYYKSGCGAASGIGKVDTVDTSGVPGGWHNGVYYFNTGLKHTDEEWDEIYAANDAAWEGTGRWPHHSFQSSQAEGSQYNRTDDPLGADADNLCYTDVPSGGPTLRAMKMEVSGEYKKEYITGEPLDLTGAVFTVTWSDETTTNPSWQEMDIQGFDTDKLGEQTLTVKYRNVSVTITVNVLPKSNKIHVTVSILGDSAHGENGQVHTLSGGGLQTWVAPKQYEADTAETVWDVLQRVFADNGITAGTKNTMGGVYIEALTRNGVTLAEFTNGTNSGWMYTYNGKHPLLGVSQQYLNDGAKIVLHYSDDFTIEEGSQGYDDVDKAVKKVIGLIDAIGDNVTPESAGKIEAARKAYDALTYAQKQQVTNYAKLTAAEAKLKELQAEEDKQAAQAVMDAIAKLPSPATEKDREAVAAARKAYDALTDAQKKLVTNYQKLVNAERDIALLDATKEDIAAADAVQKRIKALPELVTLEDKKAVEAARKAYDALTDAQKKLVTNLAVLEEAEVRLAMLEALKHSLDIYTVTGEFIENLDITDKTELYALGMARSGHEVDEVFYQSMENYVAEYIDENGRLHRSRSEDNSKTILTLTALGYDVTDVGGHNLLMGLSDMEYLKKQGVTGPAWALIALDSHDYEIPANPNAAEQASREKILDYLLAERNEDGGWSVTSDLSDAETTAIVVTALAGHYPAEDDAKTDDTVTAVKAAVDKAVQALSDMQDKDGGYSALANDGVAMESNSKSISQVLVALSALDINAHTDERFVKNGNSLIDALCEYYMEGGGFRATKEGQRDDEATELAYNALTAFNRMLNEENSLYDMSDVDLPEPKAAPTATPALTTAPAPTTEPKTAPEPEPESEPESKEDSSFWGWLTGLFK